MTKSLLLEKCGNPSLNFNLVSVQVTGESRPLRACWTPELSQDLDHYTNYHTNSYEPEEFEYVYKKILLTEKYVPTRECGYGHDVEAELSAELSRELSQQIDREILRELFNMVEDE